MLNYKSQISDLSDIIDCMIPKQLGAREKVLHIALPNSQGLALQVRARRCRPRRRAQRHTPAPGPGGCAWLCV